MATKVKTASATQTARTSSAEKQLANVSKSGALSTINPELQQLMHESEDAPTGFEERSRDSAAIPFLRILQDLSDQVKKSKPDYVPGAAPGMIFNSVTKKLYTEVWVVPAYYSEQYIEWIPRKKGGGFVATYPHDTPLVLKGIRDGAKLVLPNGNELMDTRNWFVNILDDDTEPQQAVIPMTSTAIKFSKEWFAQMSGLRTKNVNGHLVQAHMYTHKYLLGTVEMSNDQGTWSTWKQLERRPIATALEFVSGREFATQVRIKPPVIAYDELQRSQTDQSSPTPRDLDSKEEEIDA